MAVDKLVDSTQLDSDLTDVADEIRTAGGTLLPLSFPDDYVVAIGDIGNTEIKTASGSIAHFEDALARKAQDLTVAIEPVQDLHGQANPYPAGGGKNKLDTSSFAGTSYGGVTYARQDDGGIKISGTINTVASIYIVNGMSLTLQAGTYTLSGTGISQIYAYLLPGYKSGTFTLTEETTFTALQIRQDTVGYTANFTYYPQLESGSTATSFAPYSNICPISGWTGANIHVSPTTDAADGTTYSITFPSEAGTVYGGTLDVTTGKLTVDRAIKTFDGSETWMASSQQGYYCAANYIPKLYDYENSITCDKLKTFDRNSGQNYIAAEYGITGYYDYASSYPNRNWIYAKAASIVSDTQSFEQWLANNPITVCYKLATPIVYDLDPVTVTTLLGTNNVWADTGDSTIKYIAPKAQIPSAQGVYF